MANTLLLKRSSVAGKAPTTANLQYGELSLNYTDGTLYFKTNVNTIGSFVSNGSSLTANVLTITGGIFWANGAVYSSGGSGSSTTSTTAPTSPSVGDNWYNPSTDIVYRYTYDGTSYYWVDISGPVVANITSVYGNANVASYLPTYTSNITAANVTVSAGIYSPGYFYANGQPFTSSSYGNTNVAGYLPTYTGNIGGNIGTGNLTVYGNLSVTGNITTVNYETITNTEYVQTLAATNINAATIGNAGAVLYGTLNSSSANQTNITAVGTLGNLTVTGNITSGNITATHYGNVVGTTNGNAYITGSLIPTNNIAYDLGTTTQRFRSLYLSGNTIDLGGATIKTDVTTGAIAFIPQATAANPNPTGIVVSPAGTISTVTTTGGVLTSDAIGISSNASATSGTIFSNVIVNGNITVSNTITVNGTELFANVSGLQNQITGANTNISSINANIGSYYTWANANVGGLQNQITGANAAIITANSAVVSYVNTLTTSLATGANANTAAYLTTSAGNIGAGTITASNVIKTTSAINATGLGTGALTISQGGASIFQDLWVGGNIYANVLNTVSTQILQVNDPLLYLYSSTTYPYNYDIGTYSHFVGGPANIYAHTGLVRNHLDNNWYLFSNIPEPSGNTLNLASPTIVYDTLKLGNINAVSTVTVNGTELFANVSGLQNQITGANVAIITANSAVVSYVNTLNSAMASNVAGANAAIITANSAVVSYVNTKINSLATGANANTAAYLASNISTNIGTTGSIYTTNGVFWANGVAYGGSSGSLSGTTGTFSSTLTANGAVAMNPSNANVSIQPTGTGVTSISSGTVGSIVNMNIGASSPGTGAFTSLTASGQGSFTANTISTSTSTGALTITGGLGVGGSAFIGSTITVGTSNAGLSNAGYIYKSAAAISSGSWEANAVLMLGKANASGDIGVFIGSDQGNGAYKYGFIGAVNRATGYVPLAINPGGGNVGINTGVTAPTAQLEVGGSIKVTGGQITLTQTGTSTSTMGMSPYTSAAANIGGFAGSVLYASSSSGGAGAGLLITCDYGQPFVFGRYYNGTSSFTESARFDATGNFIPGTDASMNLGSASLRWKNVYTTDLHLSNESKPEGNSVDGTQGNWTIQEGADDLYILNNKTGKKYKFKLEEV